MYIHGQFLNQEGCTVTVHILTRADRSVTVEIGDEDSGIFFTDDPAEISSEVNDTFDVLLRQSATLRLLCRSLVPDFFCASCRDAVVNIYKADRCVFAGFIEPQTFSQPFNDLYDEVELNCIDALSALQYSKYRNVGALGVNYDTVKAAAVQRSFLDVLADIMGGVFDGLDIVGNHGMGLWYDGSKAVDSAPANRYGIFGQLSISELLFLGDEEDDVWQQDEVVTEILKYPDLHIAQDGFDFYIFSWKTVRDASGAIAWRDILTDASSVTPSATITIGTDNVVDCDTTVSIDCVYNQLLLTAKIEEIENVIESPLDDDLLESPYTNRQKYMTEYSSDGAGSKGYKGMTDLVNDKTPEYDACTVTDWYVQVMRNKMWHFPMRDTTDTDIVDYFCADGKNQQQLPLWLTGSASAAAILSLGSVKWYSSDKDNSPTSKINMTNCLVMSVGGNEKDGEYDSYPTEESIKKNIPYAVYNGNTAGGTFSPSDDKTTNYIVLSGKIILNPVMHVTGTFKNLRERMGQQAGGDQTGLPLPPYFTNFVPSRTNKNGRYYTRRFWKAETPELEPEWDEQAADGFYPYTGDGPEQYEFKYSEIGDSTDKISKVPVIACMLVIGDKCVVEKTPDNDQGDTDESGVPIPYTDKADEAYKNFVWKKFKNRDECTDDDEYYSQCFTVGFDPKIGDKLIGTEFDLQKTFSYKAGIDAEGTGIPIRRKDKVSGNVRFEIMGPVNLVWNNVTRRHKTWFRKAKWGENDVHLMAHVSSIIIKSFEIKVYSDNGLINNGNNDNDVVYMSDTKESFVNKKDDIEFKINSALTPDECVSLGISNGIHMSTPVNATSGDGVLELYDNNAGVSAKPERIYVDNYYTEYHKPRILLNQNMRDNADSTCLFAHYRHEALDKEFFVQGMGRNLKAGSVSVTLKEISYD